MSTYLMSDIHGHYAAYKEMLKKISFSYEDTLYILGDILDRGPHPIKTLLDIMADDHNIKMLVGNHELMAIKLLEFLCDMNDPEELKSADDSFIEDFLCWVSNGAETTIYEFLKEDKVTRRKILDFILNLDVYDEISVGGKTFILVHGGLRNFSPDKELSDYEIDELLWERPNYEIPYYDDKFVVTGHTPTLAIKGNPNPGYIYMKNNHINIDCGCVFDSGNLGCLRLDDMKEFYVNIPI